MELTAGAIYLLPHCHPLLAAGTACAALALARVGVDVVTGTVGTCKCIAFSLCGCGTTGETVIVTQYKRVGHCEHGFLHVLITSCCVLSNMNKRDECSEKSSEKECLKHEFSPVVGSIPGPVSGSLTMYAQPPPIWRAYQQGLHRNRYLQANESAFPRACAGHSEQIDADVRRRDDSNKRTACEWLACDFVASIAACKARSKTGIYMPVAGVAELKRGPGRERVNRGPAVAVVVAATTECPCAAQM